MQLSDKEPELGVAEIDQEYLVDVRSRIPNWQHRRPELYTDSVVVAESSAST